jgi:predicted dehydrogenase
LPKTYRIGAIGFAHGHIRELLRSFAGLPNVEWVAAADVGSDLTATARDLQSLPPNSAVRVALEELRIPKTYADYRELLQKEQLDICVFCPPNSSHGEVAEAAAAAGAHLLTEKPMAARLPEALRMVRAAEASGVELFVNWPTTWQPAVRKAKELLDSGIVGDLWEVKWRAGSMGPLSYGAPVPETVKAKTWWHRPETGGGALLDYCCYGACLSRWYVGEPAQAAFGVVANLASHWGTADDNAVITVRFPRALAVLEATWSCPDHGIPTGPILYGTKGTLVVERRDDKSVVRIARGRYGPTEYVEPDPLPAGRDSVGRDIINHLETGEPVHETLQVGLNLDAQAILEAGQRSAASGQMELVDNSTWGVG